MIVALPDQRLIYDKSLYDVRLALEADFARIKAIELDPDLMGRVRQSLQSYFELTRRGRFPGDTPRR
jgi:hypothetical protein